MNEQPLYILSQDKARAIIPKLIATALLEVVFYFAVLLNLSLIQLKASTESFVRVITLILLLALFVTSFLLTQKRARQKYVFYQAGIKVGKKLVPYTQITNTRAKKDTLDGIFKTYKVHLTSNIFLKHIPTDVDIPSYLNQLVSYARNYNR